MDAGQVDSLSVVLGAIAASAGAGALDAVKDSASRAVSTARDRLLILVRSKFAGDVDAIDKLATYGAEPSPAAGESLRLVLERYGVAEDLEILATAAAILGIKSTSAVGPGSIAANHLTQINKDGGTGFIGGTHVHKS